MHGDDVGVGQTEPLDGLVDDVLGIVDELLHSGDLPSSGGQLCGVPRVAPIGVAGHGDRDAVVP
ncbi:hypothetical protein CELD12_21530 [Cellulomonas sp. NTE-D12]|nr:hypothetical protein CELD12_21530 [Cellulomonas sp. NTE-D12]